MIKLIKIKDFQSHENNEFVLNKGFNIIVGPSGSGKTALLRALNSIFYNNISGTDAVRIDPRTNPANYSVTVETEEGNSITRKKGKSVNTYSIENKTTGESKEFDSVKTDVPEDVRKALNIYPIQIDTDKFVNVQYCGQFDAPFMLSESGPVKMKFLNSLSGTYAIDMAIKESNYNSAKAQKIIKEEDAAINLLSTEVEKYDKHIEALAFINKYIANKMTDLKAMLKELENMSILQEKYKYISKKCDDIGKINELFNKVNIDVLINTIDKLKTYKKLYNKYTSLNNQLNDIIKKEKIYSKIDEIDIVEKCNKLKELYRLKNTYDTLLSRRNEVNEKIKKYEEETERYTNEYISKIKEYGICPICKSVLTNDTLSHIRELI